MSIILFDPPGRESLFPLTQTRAVADLLLGMLTIKQRWQHWSKEQVFVLTSEYLQPLYPLAAPGTHLFVNAAVLPDEQLRHSILQLAEGEALQDEMGLIACRFNLGKNAFSMAALSPHLHHVVTRTGVTHLQYPWEIFMWNDTWARTDFPLLTNGKTAAAISASNKVLGENNLFVEEGVEMEFATINAATGPVYISKGAVIMEGALLRGPLFIGEKTVLKMGAKVYGATSLGPACTAGGEIKNVVMQGYSNKAHDGYLGDAVIGEWCNMGAGTTNSNVKNTGGEVKIWHHATGKFILAGFKCGLVMGDYSRTAINTAINTGSVIGCCANVFGEGLTPKVVPAFTWGMKGITRYEFEKALQDIANWKKMKHHALSEQESRILKHIFEHLLQ
ncbi:putative sugar nucleotidyl transferase [Filimonas effusa]|uniref:Glucose-1-phosphate thymidylyltransferase n=1 Tax=Filimonas effusa TaxID=2508721 RepID=A0A4V1MAK9_9BACT|nr:putative sugar nucleotidyl transferase [Filimonas effusa]RXK86236.1 glucose-1-phosphate thymidylyltransferase [Filimonas effusa]